MEERDPSPIDTDMTVLDILCAYPQTEQVFKNYDAELNVCICCEMLFETLGTVGERYGIKIDSLLVALNEASREMT